MELKIDQNLVTVGDMMGLEAGSLRAVHDFVIRFAVDADGEPMDQDEASAILKAMTLPELTEWAQELHSQLNEAAIPPVTARSSRNGSKAKARPRSG